MSKLANFTRTALARVRRYWEPSLSIEPLPELDSAQARAAIVSFYMVNIAHKVVLAQRRVLKKCVPCDIAILQIETSQNHGLAMQEFLRQTEYPIVLFLDIDCVPVAADAVEQMIVLAEGGALAGAVQRANHLDNDEHLYVAPFCMALSTALYRKMGQPTFVETARGDVGEELTYAAEALGIPIHFLWPTSVEEPIWRLTPTRSFGRGTTYDEKFWHAFQIRQRIHQERFVGRCGEIICKLDDLSP